MKSYVVKIGGHALDTLRPDSEVLVALASDVAALRDESTHVVVVHGGGPQIQALLDAVGLESRFHEGLRVTDDDTMEIVAMALAQVNLRLVAALNRAGLASVGLTGADQSLMSATALGPPWGRAASVPTVKRELVETLWASGVTPVVSSIVTDEHGELVNCNADAAAGALAGALHAEALVLLSDVDQLRRDPLDVETSLDRVTRDEVLRMIEEGSILEGMRPKMTAALDALEGGARRVLMANGTTPHAVRDALAGSSRRTEVVQ
ncbi:MAG TPA: acetylglutamate kinase [Acidimicrobiales bacterium]|nr:acetylglutamate kinase [Acidimicrobiales bacterium]